MIKRIICGFLVLLGSGLYNTVFSQNKTDFFGIKTVCIDAGHGGHDGGCQGKNSQEKHVALSIALQLG